LAILRGIRHCGRLGKNSPKLWIKPGDICEVEMECLGLLRNLVEEEAKPN